MPKPPPYVNEEYKEYWKIVEGVYINTQKDTANFFGSVGEKTRHLDHVLNKMEDISPKYRVKLRKDKNLDNKIRRTVKRVRHKFAI